MSPWPGEFVALKIDKLQTEQGLYYKSTSGCRACGNAVSDCCIPKKISATDMQISVNLGVVSTGAEGMHARRHVGGPEEEAFSESPS